MVKVVEKQAKPTSHKRELIRSMSSVFEFDDEESVDQRPHPDKLSKFKGVLKTKELETFTPRNFKVRGQESQAESKESDEELPKIENLAEELENFK